MTDSIEIIQNFFLKSKGDVREDAVNYRILLTFSVGSQQIHLCISLFGKLARDFVC